MLLLNLKKVNSVEAGSNLRMKKSFVLLEVLIGFALVSISILPFLRFPYQHLQIELDMLFEMQLHRDAQKRLADIEVRLRKNQINHRLIFDQYKKKEIYTDQSYEIKINPKISRTYREVIKFESTAQRLGNNRLKSSLLNTYIHYYYKKKKVATFQSELVVQKKV